MAYFKFSVIKKILAISLATNFLIYSDCGIFKVVEKNLGEKMAPKIGSFVSNLIPQMSSEIQDAINSNIPQEDLEEYLSGNSPTITSVSSNLIDTDIKFEKLLYTDKTCSSDPSDSGDCLGPIFYFNFPSFEITVDFELLGAASFTLNGMNLSFGVSNLLDSPILIGGENNCKYKDFNLTFDSVSISISTGLGDITIPIGSSLNKYLKDKLQPYIESFLSEVSCTGSLSGGNFKCKGI
jgi:hypothetical protein